MDINNWATCSAVSDANFWEECFPGHGEGIAAITAPFHNWIPNFGASDTDLQRDILQGTAWLGVQSVRVYEFSDAQEGQNSVTTTVHEAFWEMLERRKPNMDKHLHHSVNDAVGDAFGPVIGHPVPSVMLRAWLYQMLVDTIICELMDDHELVAQMKKILLRWKTGQFLIGFSNQLDTLEAIVIVADR